MFRINLYGNNNDFYVYTENGIHPSFTNKIQLVEKFKVKYEYEKNKKGEIDKPPSYSSEEFWEYDYVSKISQVFMIDITML